MRILMTIFFTAFMFVWTFSTQAADNKKIEKKIVANSVDDQAGLGIMVISSDDPDVVRVSEVFKDSEAERIGIKAGDIINQIDGQKISSPSDIINAMKGSKAGDTRELVILRDGAKKTFTATLKPFKTGKNAMLITDSDGDEIHVNVLREPGQGKEMKFITAGDSNTPFDTKGGYLGVSVKEISDQLKSYFQVTSGVLIEEIAKDSPAEKSGLKAGDVISKLNDRKIEDPQDLVRSVNYFNPEEKVKIHYVRKGDTKSLDVVLGKKPTMTWHSKKMTGSQTFEWQSGPGEKEIIIENDVSNQGIPAGNKEIIELRKEVVIF